MIKFFRTIRQNHINKGKTINYFKYALGEIVLVVIGILIALQINNWNEQRKESALEKKLLNELYISIANDTINLNNEKNNLQKVLDHATYIKQKFNDNTPYEKKLDTSFAFVSNVFINEADYIVYNRILDVGIDIIKNDSLKNFLMTYYNHSKYYKNIEQYYENSKYFRQHIYPSYFKSFKHSREAIPIDYENLKTASEFNIALDYCINDAQFFKNMSIHRKEDALDILKILKQVLKL